MEPKAFDDESPTEPPPGSAADGEAESAPEEEGNRDDLSPRGSSGPEHEVAQLASEALTRRLTPAEEERAIATIKDCLLAGKTGVAAVAETLPQFAWMVGVAGVTAAWGELKATTKT